MAEKFYLIGSMTAFALATTWAQAFLASGFGAEHAGFCHAVDDRRVMAGGS